LVITNIITVVARFSFPLIILSSHAVRLISQFGTFTVSFVLLLLTQVFALGLITGQAVTSSVEGEASGGDFEVLEKILMLVGLKLTAWLGAVLALADLFMDSSDASFLLAVDPVVVSKSLKFHAAKTSLEVKLGAGWLLNAVIVAVAVAVIVAFSLFARHHWCVLSPAVVQVSHVVFHYVVWLVVLVAAVVVFGLLLVVQEDWVVSISVVLLVGFILRVAVLIVVVVSHARLVIENVALFTEHHHLTSDRLVNDTVALVNQLCETTIVGRLVGHRMAR